MKKKNPTSQFAVRKRILDGLETAFSGMKCVHAMWQGGAAAFGRVDAWSDIDLVLDVDDGKFGKVFSAAESVLNRLHGIERTDEYPVQIVPGAYQKTYRLKKVTPFLIIEICLVPHSSKSKLTEREIHGNIIVHFDRSGVTIPPRQDKKALKALLTEKKERLINMHEMYGILVEKELNRGNFVEALAFYNGYSLGILLDLLRMRYCPARHNFRTRYFYYDLPARIAQKLERLYFVKDAADLARKHRIARKWFKEISETITVK